jgi:hypothetical protein
MAHLDLWKQNLFYNNLHTWPGKDGSGLPTISRAARCFLKGRCKNAWQKYCLLKLKEYQHSCSPDKSHFRRNDLCILSRGFLRLRQDDRFPLGGTNYDIGRERIMQLSLLSLLYLEIKLC